MGSSVYLLHHCTLSIPPFRVPSTVNVARTTRPNFRFSHSSTSLPMSSGRHIGRLLTPIVCAADGVSTPPTNNKGDDKIVRTGIGAAIALTCVLGVIGCSYMINQKAITSPKIFVTGSSRHKNIHQPAAKANELMELMDRGKHNTVSEKLKGMFQENPDEAYSVGMELIKILISRERFRDGVTISGQLEGLYGKSTSAPLKKGNLFLYKVLMHGMVGEIGEAELSWNKFKNLLGATSVVPVLPRS
ncbi:uncharacterized protein LOC117923452 [Vitis riparia]|uniref:uncharacterized protein LOC117923452 n=1 Tax=Vitis riparia TaxID=96939 RepID=UPI00155B2056|nr:uncharacterized protein LOC117923452 [Vitis riparia]